MYAAVQNYRPRQNRHVQDRQHYQQSLMNRSKDSLLKLATEAGCPVSVHTPKPRIVQALVAIRFGEAHR